MDEIRIDNLEIYAHHGVFEHEKINGQNFYVNAVLYTDTFKAGQSDDLTLSVDYGEVCNVIESIMTSQTFDLIETVAQSVAMGILRKFDRVISVDIEIRKPDAPIKQPFESVSVKIHRGWQTAVVALGSNLGNSRELIESAVKRFYDDENFKCIRTSQLIITKPYGYTDQPDFLNGAMIFKTLLPPHELLEFMQGAEQAANRKREIHWGPRTLDLDLIFYADEIIADEKLIVPHPDMENRDFVLRPVNEIAPYYRHPVSGRTVCQLLQSLERTAKND